MDGDFPTKEVLGGSNPSVRANNDGEGSSMVEPWIVIPVVAGSSPVLRPKLKLRVAQLYL